MGGFQRHHLQSLARFDRDVHEGEQSNNAGFQIAFRNPTSHSDKASLGLLCERCSDGLARSDQCECDIYTPHSCSGCVYESLKFPHPGTALPSALERVQTRDSLVFDGA